MRIGELAKRVGVSTSKVRFYEAQGLVPTARRLANGYRDYDPRAVEVVAFVDRARSLGFPLRDIREHLESPNTPQRKARLQARLEVKLAELDAHAVRLQARRAELVELITQVRRARTART